ncbi:hypothetical protein EGT07_01515 [Herbaspirillum sp. HC18]|nr:hypothetical protein EGT07_01515 [Herbaspirillum sp. HC18]
MKRLKLLLAFLLLALGASGAAWADGHGHGHVGVGVYFGPGWGGWYYPPPYAYYPYPAYPAYPGYPYPAAVSSGPVTYVERAPAMQSSGPVTEAPRAQSNNWYYCHQPDGYYPYIKECPGGWQTVPAQPQR